MIQSFFNSNKKSIYKIAAIVVPIIFIILAIIVTTYVKNIYNITETRRIENETKFASFELSENLRQTIMYRAKALEILAETHTTIFPKNKQAFDKYVTAVWENIPDFFAINWVSPDGVIRWVSPLKNNEAALEKNILKRVDVTKYLEESRDKNEVQISHFIDLYQGPKGLIIYVPIYDGKTFKGWYNGVVDIQSSFDRFFERRNIKNLTVKIKVKGHENFIYAYKKDSNGIKKINFDVDILNQVFNIEVIFNKGTATNARNDQLLNIFNIIYVAIAVTAIFLFYLIRSQFQFMDLNRKLTRDRTLINILSHDMATPLTLISENTKKLKEKIKDKELVEVDRILKSSEKQMNLLTRVRSFHATNIGRIHIELLPVNTKELISETLAAYEEALKSKEITCVVETPEKDLYCLTDRMTAVDNVLGNVISNAIKFSENNSKIHIRSYKDKKCVVIEIQDQGSGIPKNVLHYLFNEDKITSRKGTKGEVGTGLGMLQVKAFMEYYKGSVKVQTSDKGTIVQLFFKQANI